MAAWFGDWETELRRCAGQHWWANGMDLTGAPTPMVLGWAENRDVLNDRRLSPRSFVDDMIASGLSPEAAAQVSPLFSRHGDDHRHLRAVLSSAFTPKKVEQLRPATRAIADRLADAVTASDGRCEIVAAFAEPLPPEVFAVLFGLPVEDRDRLAAWASRIALAFSAGIAPGDLAIVETAAAEMRDYGRERIAASRAEPGDDLVTRLLEAEVDGQHLSDDDVIAMITGFVFAGAETTRRQMTAGILLLADHPDDWERLAAEPDLIPTAVDEILRLRGIVPALTRRAEEPFERDGLELHERGRLMLSFTAGNLDPERFADPTAFQVDRADAHAHLTFGWGPHLCVGAGLARLELAEGLRALTSRFGPPAIEAVGPTGGFATPDWVEVAFPVAPAEGADVSGMREAMQAALGAVPTHQLIGLEVIATGEEGPAIMEIPLSDNALGATGRLHGGVIALLCDVALAVAASSGSTYDHATQALVTADLHVRYLGVARGDRVRAEASVVKAGRALVVVEGRVTDGEGNLIAVADLSATIVQRRS